MRCNEKKKGEGNGRRDENGSRENERETSVMGMRGITKLGHKG